MTLAFLRRRRQQKASTQRDEYVSLLQRAAELGDDLPPDEQSRLAAIAEQAGISDIEIERGAEINRQYPQDKSLRDAIPSLRAELNKDRQAVDAHIVEVNRVRKEQDHELDDLRRKVASSQSQLDEANIAKSRCDRAELCDWKPLGLPRVARLVHLFSGNPQKMLEPGVTAAVNISDFATGKLDADDFQFSCHSSQTTEDFSMLVNQAQEYRRMAVDEPAAKIISDPMRAPAPPPTMRDADGSVVSEVTKKEKALKRAALGKTDPTLPENKTKTKWQVQLPKES
ncbi:MAG TPA: hypothetical protein VGG19_05995 [Tepidisphaeraceae bacterium]|jgi:hypothetical protein